MSEKTSGVVADGRTIHTRSGARRPGETFTAEPAEIARLMQVRSPR